MDANQFDAITRQFASKVSRRTLIGAATALVAAAAMPFKVVTATVQSDASDLVLQFYKSIDAYLYDQAYALVGSKWKSQQSLDVFTKGYADTAFVQCQVTGEQAAANGTTVLVKLISWHNDGKITGYTGHYVVGTEGGKLRILSGNNTLGAAPQGTPPLCKISDLSLSIGPWNAAAGSRYSAVIGTNNGAAACALGGSPRLILKDANKRVIRSTSEPSSPPVAIIVAPGQGGHAPVRFTNFCGAKMVEPVSVFAEVPGDTHDGTVDDANGISYPPCLGENAGMLLGVQGWQSGTAS